MHRCFQLAALGAGNVAPNPMVGALLVHDNKIIGEGFHMRYGEAHAEVNCIANVPGHLKHLIPASTLYVSLEPCTHFGNTPPCCDLIIKSGIQKVVIGCIDGFEKVNGTGVQKLREAGIDTTVGILEKEALELNKRFFTFHKKQRPYIILKWAQSNNLKIAAVNRSPMRISNDRTNRLVHKWRSEEAAIMIGTTTAMQDNPSLTTRHWPGNSPLRVVIDTHLKLPSSLHFFDGLVPTLILNSVKQSSEGTTTWYKTGESDNMVAVALSVLRQRNLTSLIVEGGSRMIESFIEEGCWDEARVITNRHLAIPGGVDAPRIEAIPGRKEIIGTDEIAFYQNATEFLFI